MQAAMEEINEGIDAAPASASRCAWGSTRARCSPAQVGDGYTVIGDTVNVAARLQAAARPGSVTVGETTHRLTRGAIEYEELEPLTLKGKAEPVPAWEAVRLLACAARGAAGARRRRRSSAARTSSTLLVSLFERVVREGRPHLVTVIGQAGVGKSRLLREFERAARRPRAAGRLPASGRCPPYGVGHRLLGARRGHPRASSRSSTTDDAERGLGEAPRRRSTALIVDEAEQRRAAGAHRRR